MQPTQANLFGWTAKNDVEIKRSTSHNEMYVITQSNGKFHTINTSEAVMLRMHPPKSQPSKRQSK